MSPIGNGTSVVVVESAGTVDAAVVVVASFWSPEHAAAARPNRLTTATVRNRGRRGVGLRFTDTRTTVPAGLKRHQGRVTRWGWDQRPYVRPRTVTRVTDLEREYSPSSRVGGSSQPFVDDYIARSAAVATTLGDRVQVLAGGTRLVSAGPGSPLLVFIHGGYWQALSAADSLYLAPGALAAGWSFAAIEYTLAPAAGLAIMVDECRAALAALATHGPFTEVVLAGHSAGAHLAAVSALVSPSPLPLDRLVLVSGVYDLRPLVHTTINEPLGLDEIAAAEISPALLPVASSLPVLLTVGDNETEAFIAQQRVYAARVRAGGCPAWDLVAAGRHHFDIVDELVGPTGAIGAFTLGGIHP